MIFGKTVDSVLRQFDTMMEDLQVIAERESTKALGIRKEIEEKNREAAAAEAEASRAIRVFERIEHLTR